MTDRETLFHYRLQQAEETISDARRMFAADVSPRSVVNRAYYAAFYMILALFQKDGLNPKTSKHSGVIGLFDKTFVMTGRIDRSFGKIIHGLFDSRQECDYKEFSEVSSEDAREAIEKSAVFIAAIHSVINQK